ncbi:SDR family NAD(P)-dependent oxidoreductase [Mycolicibacterium thermoresistibile]
MVLAFAGRGADVIVSSRKLDTCQAVAAEVEQRFARRAMPIAANVSNWQQCDDLVAAAYREFGRVDVLVNNAGLSPLYPSLNAVEESLFDKVLALNLKGPFRLTAAIGTRMAAGDGGSVINVSSTGSIRPQPEFLAYAAAKAGLNTLTEGFAHAFGPSVRVNTIMPGRFRTDIAKAWDIEAVDADARTSLALQRVGEPNEIIGAALYFASAASSYCTGATLRVDGGIQ